MPLLRVKGAYFYGEGTGKKGVEGVEGSRLLFCADLCPWCLVCPFCEMLLFLQMVPRNRWADLQLPNSLKLRSDMHRTLAEYQLRTENQLQTENQLWMEVLSQQQFCLDDFGSFPRRDNGLFNLAATAGLETQSTYVLHTEHKKI